MEQIMNQTDVKVSFYLKKSEADADGNCPVMAKLNVGKYSEAAFSVKMKVPQSRWASGRASGKSMAAKEINNRLDEIRAIALGIYAEQSAVRDGVTAEEVKGILLGMASGQETLLGYFRRFISNFEKRVGINRTVGSLRAYSNAYSLASAIQIVGYPVFRTGPFFHRQIRPVSADRAPSRSKDNYQPDRAVKDHCR